MLKYVKIMLNFMCISAFRKFMVINVKDFLTQDNIEPEIMLHSEYIEWFNKRNVCFLSWGSKGPDFLLPKHNIIGEVKKENTIGLLKNAIKELYERSKPQFKISSFSGFFVIAGNVIRYYSQTNKDKWQDVDINDCLVFSGSDRDIFLDFINSQNHKVNVEDHMEYALNFILNDKFEMCVSDGLRLIFNLNNNNRIIVKRGIYFNPDEDDEIFIDIKCDTILRKEIINFMNVFTISDINRVKEYIKHNYSSHLPDSKKANLGKYYTPKEIVETLKKQIEHKIKDNSYVMDLSCGCGAFLELFDDCHIIGRDVDSQAIEILELFNFTNVAADNTLLNVSRSKYGLSKEDDIIIIGNPPYNDTSSINKRYNTKAKNKRYPEDSDIHCRDIGRSFLEAYAKLNPRYICILHPLSFLIKKQNFKSLKYLSKNYRLENAIVFKSSVFVDLFRGTPFPIVIATYVKDDKGMDYDYICNYIFDIYGSNKKFSLSKIIQADHQHIHQTVTNVDKTGVSDIGLYHYNFRDINSLNKSNFQNESYRAMHINSMLVVNYSDLWKYCYVNCVKKFLLPMLSEGDFYILGNLNPIMSRELIDSDDTYWKDLFITCAILKNSHRIKCMNIDDQQNNFLTKKFLINDFKKRSRLELKGRYNFYKSFLLYIETKDETLKNEIYECVNNYFRDLIKDILI
nr:MAG TPA: N-6 DNA Methylase [Caudoviricetes sp.]